MNRRHFLGGLAQALLGAQALAADGPFPREQRDQGESRSLTPDIHISYGQSDRTISWPDFAGMRFPIGGDTVLALHLSVRAGGRPGGAAATDLGILPNLSTKIDGVCGYDGSDRISMGNTAILAQQLLRRANGKPVRPILEFCCGYPGCTWMGPCNSGVSGLKVDDQPWRDQLLVIAAIKKMVTRGQLAGARFVSVGYTQIGSNPDTAAQKLSDMTEMFAAYDALSLAAPDKPPLNFYITHEGVNARSKILNPSILGQFDVVSANANGRTWGTSPLFQWPLADGTHLNAYGVARAGEAEGYAKYVVEDEGLGHYYPLRHWKTSHPIKVNGQTVTVPWDRPSGNAFSVSQLSWRNDPNDGIWDWPQKGFNVFRDGVALKVAPRITGLNIDLIIEEKLKAGDRLEVSYAYRGPGGGGTSRNGVGGNLIMTGPESVLFPGNTIDSWAWPFLESVTV